MKRRGVRLALVGIFLVVLAAAGVASFRLDQRAAAARAAARDFDLASQQVQASLVDARGSLQAALIPSQGADYWLPRATTSLEAARTGLAALKQVSVDGAVLNDLDAATAAVDQLVTTRAELSRLLRNDLQTQAAGLLFGEALDTASSASERVEGARLGEIARADLELAAARAYLLLGSGVTLALALVVIGLLLPTAGAERDAARAGSAIESRETTTAEPQAREATPLEPLPVPAIASPAPVPLATSDTQAAAPAAVDSPGAHATQVIKDRRKAPELRAAADLCTDFARLVDARELPALLDRAAKLLDANGFIVWLAEPGGQALRPSLAHGYPPQALARLPAIPRGADNATAAAFRHAEMQVVRTDGMSPGAIVVPLVGPTGCVGAVAAEVRHGREASESLRALARIVAAQISTLVAANTAAAMPESRQQAAG